MQEINKIRQFPILFFGAAMGLCGLTLSYERINAIFGISDVIFELLKWITTLCYVAILSIYFLKLIKYPDAVRAELNHPVRINFFAAFSIASMLLATIYKDTDIVWYTLYYIGAGFQTFIVFYVFKFLINTEFDRNFASPAWFLPMVGNIIVILAARQTDEIYWFHLSVGLFCWAMFFSVILGRLIFEKPLPPRLMPSLFIMIVPPAICFVDYIKLTGEFDFVAKFLLNITLFFVILMIFLARNFTKLEFYISWWAFTFPTAAATVAFLRAYEIGAGRWFLGFGTLCFILLTIFVAFISVKTIKALIKGDLSIFE